MRTAVWILLGWFWLVVWSAAAAPIAPAHVAPDAALITVVFLALHRTPIQLAIATALLGFLAGHAAGSPIGLHETALLLVAVGVYLTSGRLAGSGTIFFGFLSALALAGYHLLMFLLLYVGRGSANFSSWMTAVLLPNALLTAAVALVSHRPMAWLETKLSPSRHDGLL